MKISYCSDLHIEAGQIKLENTSNADVLVLAGDICVAKSLNQYNFDSAGEYHSDTIHEFFINCSKEFKHVVYVVGNHEHYGFQFEETIHRLKSNLSYIKNLYILDDSIILLEDVAFIGGTMWTDMNDNNELTHKTVSCKMNDFRVIRHNDKKFTTVDAVDQFKRTTGYINLVTDIHKDMKIVVVTHHSPSYKSIAPEFEMDYHVNRGYHSNCEYLMKDNIVAWIFGHTHSRHAYYINNTLVTNNARGYNRYENCAKTFELKTINLTDMPTKEELKTDQYWLFHPRN